MKLKSLENQGHSQTSLDAIKFLTEDKEIKQFAIFGSLLAIRTKNIILVYRNHVDYVQLRKIFEIKKEIRWVWEDEVTDNRYSVSLFQANEAGWNYALGFIRQFGGAGDVFLF